MAFVIFPDMDINTVPRFEFDPDWPDGGEKLEERTWVMLARGLRIAPEHVPKIAILTSRHSKLANIILLMRHAWAVSDRVRSMWNRIAPTQVEYVPMQLVRKNRQPVSNESYYFINIERSLDCMDWDRSNFVLHPDRAPSGVRIVDFPPEYPEVDVKIVIRRNRRGDAHIWREADSGCMSNWIFVSDKIGNEMRSVGITGIEYMPVIEI